MTQKLSRIGLCSKLPARWPNAWLRKSIREHFIILIVAVRFDVHFHYNLLLTIRNWVSKTNQIKGIEGLTK